MSEFEPGSGLDFRPNSEPNSTNEPFSNKMVYIKPISETELEELYSSEEEVPGGDLFSVYGVNGTQLAVVAGRQSAIWAAEEFGMIPQLVH
jgi:hypothetical protein